MKIPDAPELTLNVAGTDRSFDLDHVDLPDWIDDHAFTSGGYPYPKRMKTKDYENSLETLQEELVKLQYWLQETGERVMMVFEGRDAAGKGGTIGRFRQYLNPRHAKVVALSKPSDTERGQWYFQRYVSHFPTAGELALYDRSWYNRAGVEPVMGFCDEDQHKKFLQEVPGFEKMIVDEGIHFFKFWLNIGQEMQLKRFHDRRHNPLKVWKLSPIDLKAMTKWDAYTQARNTMMEATHTPHAPWTVIRTNDKRRGRVNAIRHVLLAIPYEGRNLDRIGEPDHEIIGPPDRILAGGAE